MPTNKNQHFVPRCHLKPFTLDAEGLAINLYNIDRARVIKNAPVKNQCSRDYFYGNSLELEAIIQALESRYADVVRRICDNPRRINEADAAFLSSYWIFQHVRTEAMQQGLLRQSDDLRELFGEEVKELTLTKKDATLIALSAFAKNSDAISDLKVVLIKNQSDTPFLTSDNPATQTNRWALHNSKRGVSTFGMHSAGAIALLPIAPNLLVLFYDKDIYSVPHDDGVVVVRSASDVRALNEHQILNCASNLYLPPTFSAAHVAELPDLTEQRASSGPRCHVFQKESNDENKYFASNAFDREKGTEAIVATPTYFASPAAWPSFLHWRNKGFYFSNGSGAGHIRRAKVVTDRLTKPFQKMYTGR